MTGSGVVAATAAGVNHKGQSLDSLVEAIKHMEGDHLFKEEKGGNPGPQQVCSRSNFDK